MKAIGILVVAVLYCIPCAVNAAKKIAPGPAELAITQGYVYANLPKNYGNEVELYVRAVTGKKDVLLTPRADPLINAVGAWLPQGEYTLAKWKKTAAASGDYPLKDYVHFMVEPGRVTDLGSLVAVPIGGYQFVVLPIRPVELADRVKDATNEFQSVLTAVEPIVWKSIDRPNAFLTIAQPTGMGLVAALISEYDRKVNKPPLRKQLEEEHSIDRFLQLAKLGMPPLENEATRDDLGNLYFGADYGQIRVRNTEGVWSNIDLNTVAPVTAVVFSGGQLVSGTGNGVLRASVDHGKTWREVSRLPPNESIENIHHIGDRWFVAAFRLTAPKFNAQATNLIKIYSTTANNLAELTVNREMVVDAWKFLDSWSGVGIGGSDAYYFVNAYPDFWRVEVKTLDWKKLAPPGKLANFGVSGNGVVTAFTPAGLFSKLYVSDDQGNSWQKYAAPPLIIRDIDFVSKSSGRATRSAPGAFLVTQELLTYDTTKNHWNKMSEAPQGCIRILHDDLREPKFCLTNGGSILSKREDQWIVEFTAD